MGPLKNVWVSHAFEPTLRNCMVKHEFLLTTELIRIPIKPEAEQCGKVFSYRFVLRPSPQSWVLVT